MADPGSGPAASPADFSSCAGCQAGGEGHPDLRAAIPQGEDPRPRLPPALPRGQTGGSQLTSAGGVGLGFWPHVKAASVRSSRPRLGLGAVWQWTAPSRPSSRRRLSSGISTCVSPPRTSSAAARWVPCAPGWARGQCVRPKLCDWRGPAMWLGLGFLLHGAVARSVHFLPTPSSGGGKVHVW